jgi:aspartate racemase
MISKLSDKNGGLGIIGGMGPLASTEFVNRIYKYQAVNCNEQDTTFIMHYSDPSMPDRTVNFLKGEEQDIYEKLLKILSTLENVGVDNIVICCFTIHHLIPRLPIKFQEKIISLVDVVINSLMNYQETFLFLSTTGTIKMKIMQNHPSWEIIKCKILFLEPEDQDKMHDIIYKHLKKGKQPELIQYDFLNLIKKYNVSGFIAGCTEIHLLTNNKFHLEQNPENKYIVIDPLDIIAKNYSSNLY